MMVAIVSVATQRLFLKESISKQRNVLQDIRYKAQYKEFVLYSASSFVCLVCFLSRFRLDVNFRNWNGDSVLWRT